MIDSIKHLYQEIYHGRSLTSQRAEKYAPGLLQTIFRGSDPANYRGDFEAFLAAAPDVEPREDDKIG